MTAFSAIIDNGLTSAEGFQKAISNLLVKGVPTVTTPTSLQVVQRGAGANMSVDVSIGSALIPNSTGTFGYAAWQDAVSNVTITAADPSNPRIDAIVAYINLSAVSTSSNNNPGSLVFTAIAGTPAGSPSAPSDSTIQSTLGATVPWVRLANVTVGVSATQIVTANIADARPPFAVRAYLWGGTSNTNGHTVPNVADDTVALLNATQTLANKTFTSPTVNTPTVKQWDGWQKDTSGITYTYNANNGNKEFVLTPSADPTGFLSPGMRFKHTRHTVPPTQCMAFTAASSQYATKASPTGITFTSAWTTEAWIYILSYGDYAIESRYDGTQGWRFAVNSSGQLYTQYLASGANHVWTTYQSIPLKRWVHVAITHTLSGPTITTYINGVSVPNSQTTNTGTQSMTQGGALQIGAFNGANFFDGYIAEARVWSAAQSAASIQANMAINLTGTETNLVALFKGNGNFNDGTSNANNLTATNGAIATQAANPFNAIEYAFITKVASGAVTVFCGTDYTIPNDTLDSPAYSTQKAPYGFPAGREKWHISCMNIAPATTTGTSGTWVAISGAPQMTVPTGSWILGYKGTASVKVTGATSYIAMVATLSTSSSAETDKRFTTHAGTDTGSTNVISHYSELSASGGVTLSSATLYYLLYQPQTGGTLASGTQGFGASVAGGNTGTTEVIAELAYA